MFKTLTYAERQEFRAWANDNFVAGGEINSTWHPVVQARCAEINSAKRAADMEFTPMERVVLRCLIDGLYAEPGFSDVTISDLVRSSELSMDTVKGVLGSLTKKDAVFSDPEYRVSTDSGEMDGEVIQYLGADYYLHHKEWAEEEGIAYVPLS